MKEPEATFAAAPGQAGNRPGTRTSVAGVVLAGAWTDTGWPATMEGAVRSGLRAAREAATDTGGSNRLIGPQDKTQASQLENEVSGVCPELASSKVIVYEAHRLHEGV